MNRPEIERTRGGLSSAKVESKRTIIFTIIIGEERFGLPIDCVRTVFRSTAITPVPLAPSRMIGLINLRGHVVTAICMHTSLGLPRPRTEPSLIVAIEYRGEGFALAVDNVGDVHEVGEDLRVPVPTTISPIRRALTEAAYRTKDAVIPVLKIGALLGADHEAEAA